MKTDSLLDVASRSPIPSSTSPCLLQPLPSPSPCLQPPGMDGPIALQHSKHRQRSSALESEGNVWLKKRNAQFQCLCSFRKDQIPFSRFEEFQRKDRDLPCWRWTPSHICFPGALSGPWETRDATGYHNNLKVYSPILFQSFVRCEKNIVSKEPAGVELDNEN